MSTGAEGLGVIGQYSTKSRQVLQSGGNVLYGCGKGGFFIWVLVLCPVNVNAENSGKDTHRIYAKNIGRRVRLRADRPWFTLEDKQVQEVAVTQSATT